MLRDKLQMPAMPQVPPISASDYYDLVPHGEHYPGDIWSDLPTFGILPEPLVHGLVVTPACDLTNRKVDTITYLPIVSVRRYMSSVSLLPEIKKAVEGQLKAGGLDGLASLPAGFAKPPAPDLDALAEIVRSHLSSDRLSDKHKSALGRATAGMEVLAAICCGKSDGDLANKTFELLGEAKSRETRERIIRNSFRVDLHFLPSDGQRPEWSGIPEHSVALFRYALTVPVEILDLAQAAGRETWAQEMTQIGSMFPCANAFLRAPLRRLRVRPRFLSDLITRFSAVFGRIGSPDFTDETVSRYSLEIEVNGK